MKLETVGGYRIIDAVDQVLMSLIAANRTPGIYKAGTWRIKVTSFRGDSTAVFPAPDNVANRLHACLTAYEADTGNWEYKRVFRDDLENLWVCECTNES